jgi:hypothetical protein
MESTVVILKKILEFILRFYKTKNKTMKNKLLNIEQLALMLFDDGNYDTFMSYVNNHQINSARLFLENNVDYLDLQDNNIYNRLEDNLMDLIIEEIDGEGERESKQIIKSTE